MASLGTGSRKYSGSLFNSHIIVLECENDVIRRFCHGYAVGHKRPHPACTRNIDDQYLRI